MEEQSTPRSATHVIGTRLIFALLAIYCVLGAATVIVDSARLLHNPWENTYFESPQTYAGISGANRQAVHSHVQAALHAATIRAALLCGECSHRQIAHLDVDGFIFDARLVTYIAYLLCGAMVFVICETAGGSATSCLSGGD